ncbi:ATP-dependent DNA helicase RecQ [Prevotella sp. kh1p2]|uniref:RecQ family ATP-dependent DNA helicase n=1 Tax=Prevotella sp. kh1p2 TaxID=1761883 RepID=UPI0008AFFDCB|nr:ATP-dependent DNA helicase RecQ [Prevotella sp. kh1p2]SES95575.1 ATP-dependent DNA helicase RecQ [Prevotella sp. kh1p2]SNU11295.1 ATP-dependent DNA helicase RecQ [Prevotellaceae bacterium KH2P17]
MSDRYLDLLRQYWGYPDFRGIQRSIIESIGSGRDTLGLMPTGGGKSVTFQVPALAAEGVCIVITPLIALMKDQVAHLQRQGIRSAAIYSGMTRQEIIKTLENCVFGGVKILYVSPERLSSDLFQAKLRHINVSFITVDEAHCISQWGYDFRPSYLQIADIRKLKPGVPVLALTATATPDVVDDIQERLGFGQKNVFRMSFERRNLAYIVRRATDKYTELVHILNSVGGSAIVYVRSRRHAKELAQLMDAAGMSATFYHAGLDHAIKDQRQKAWQADEARIMVATNAFGMGIDKPDVRVVVHFDCPDSIEAYFQEAGRAGRDGRKAYAVLLYNDGDERKLNKRIGDNFPDKDYIRQVYEHLAYYYQIGVGSGGGHTFEFDIDKFSRTFRHFPIQVDASLKILQRAGYLDYEMDPDASARVMFLLERNELYRLSTLSPHEDAVITALLRNYGGLFTDYGYIDEALIAQQSGLDKQQVYLILKSLSQHHILHFVPRRKTPYITYTRDRDDAERLIIPPEVYERRREQYTKRIHAMLEYATTDYICRSRQLLKYFGESRSSDCGQCDVCLEQSASHDSEERTASARREIIRLLSDGERHHVTELNGLGLPTRQLDSAIEQLVFDETVLADGSYISINPSYLRRHAK